MAATTKKSAAKRPAKKTAKKAAKRPARTRSTSGAASSTAKARRKTVEEFHATGVPRGRPPSITDPSLNEPDQTVGVAIPNLVALGWPPGRAAIKAGITPDILDGWVHRGTEAWARLLMDETAVLADEDAPYVALIEELALAEAHDQGGLYVNARKRAEVDARWHGVYVGMRYPAMAGPQRLEVTGAGGGPIRTQTEVWSLSKLEAAVSVAEANHRRQKAIDTESRELTA